MVLNFLHPRTSASFTADVDPHTTGETCIRGLLQAGFLEPSPDGVPHLLVLTRTNRQVPPNATMQQAGVMDGDTLAVALMERGAACPSAGAA